MSSTLTTGGLVTCAALVLCAAFSCGAHAQGDHAAVQAPQPIFRINCGGPAMPAPYGPPFLADQPYNAVTHAGYTGGIVNTFDPGQDLGGLLDPHAKLHDTARIGWKSYRFDVPSGSYLLRLHFAEIDVNVEGPGLRHFGVAVEDVPVLQDFDPAALFGIRYAAELVVPVQVADGRLDVSILPGGTPAILNAIEVWTRPAMLPAPPAVTGLTAKDGYGRTIVSWDPVLDTAVTGFRVSRAGNGAGPYTEIGTTWASPPRFLDTLAPVGPPSFYRVEALGPDAAGPFAQSGEAESHAPADAALPVYELAVTPENLKALDQLVLTDPDAEVPGVFTHAGASQAVSVRYRGGGSLLASKKSWKVKFPDSALFQGREELNLKATFLDESLSVEPLAHVLFEAVDHPVSMQRRVHLFVNGADRGVFNDIEQVDEHYLAARDRDLGGSIYKAGAGNADFALLPTPADYELYYEKKTNTQQPYDDLIALIELVNAPGTTVLQFADVFDVESYLDYLAVVGWDGDADQSSRNFYLLHDFPLARWEWITWDNDRALFSPTAPIDGATSTCEVCSGINHLKEFVLSDPGLRWRYCEKLRALMQGAASPLSINASIAAIHAEMEADVHADTAKLGWERDTLFDAAPTALSVFVHLRIGFVTSELASYEPPQPPTTVWINELMADNVTSLADEAGEYDDWAELYNADALPRDVGGLYLTDDLAQPTQWRIPDGTLIPGNGHLLVWCDKDTAQGPLHANFKLGAAGGELGLIAADGATLLDVIHWRPQLPDVSYGRTEDGGVFFRLLPTPTPLSSNTTAGNLPPIITWVENAPVLPTSAQAVTISALVQDDEPPLAVTLSWRKGSAGAFNTLAMTALENERWEAKIPAQPAGSQVEYFVSAEDALGALGNAPTSAPADVFTYLVSNPQPSSLRIGEFMADNGSTLMDEAGTFEDWVEVTNTGASMADLSGLFLTDDLTQPTKWEFPAGTLLAPHGHVLVWADEDPQDGPLHAAFKLSKSGESVALFDRLANDNALLDAVVFGPQLTDVSTGLLPDGPTAGGAGVLVSLLDPSPGADNSPLPGATRRYDALAPSATASALAATSAARIGAPFTLHLQLAPASAQGLLVIGVQVLHVGLGADGVLLLYPLLSISVPFTTQASGTADVSLPIPGNAALAGLLIEAQTYVLGSGLSNAVAATLGG